MLEIISKEKKTPCRMMVVGVGGAGNNAINRMINMGMDYVEYLAINTDIQDLMDNKALKILQIGKDGLGAGARPDKGQKAAEDNRDAIEAALEGVKMVFITAGMGGGTGTGAAPVIAKIAKDMGILTVAVVTKPFRFEGKPRMNNALAGIERISDSVDTLIVISNDQIRKLPSNDNLTFQQGMMKADEVLQQTVQGISELIANVGTINLDFSDLETAMRDKGIAHIGIGEADGEDRARKAIRQALESPLLETNIVGASDVIINVSGKITMKETEEIGDYVIELAGYDTNVLYGVIYDDDSDDETLRATLIATGIKEVKDEQPAPPQHSSGKVMDMKDIVAQRKDAYVMTGTGNTSPVRPPYQFGKTKNTGVNFEVPSFLRRKNEDK